MKFSCISFFMVGILLIHVPCLLAQKSVSMYRITDEASLEPAEVSVAINPRDDNNIIVVGLERHFADGERGITNYAYVTQNNGKTWQRIAQRNPERRVQGDDAVVFSAEGVAYRSYISFLGIRQARPKIALNGIFVSRSDDKGLSWSWPFVVVDHENTVEPFEDKPWLVVDRIPTSLYHGNVYIAWTRFDKYGSASEQDSTYIFFSRSTNGKTFLPIIRISDVGGDALDGDNTVEGAVPAVGIRGEVYVAWSGKNKLFIDKSTDGGQTFGKDVIIGEHVGGWAMDVPHLSRANGMPVLSIDHSQTKHRGTLYITWIDERLGQPQVFLTYSKDDGKTWAKPYSIHHKKQNISATSLHFMPWLMVDSRDGSINIAYFQRMQANDNATHVYLSRSEDGGKTFRHYQVTKKPFETNTNLFFGDYLGIDAMGGKVVVTYPVFVNDKELAIDMAIYQF